MNKKVLSILIISIFIVINIGAIFTPAKTINSTKEIKKFNLPKYVPGEVIVTFKQNLAKSQTKQILNQNKETISFVLKDKVNIATVNIEPGKELSFCKTLKNNENIKSAQPNYISIIHRVPNDQKYNEQYGPQLIRCEDGWSKTTGSRNVKIAILDTGVDYNHEDLSVDCIDGYDFVDVNINDYIGLLEGGGELTKHPGEDYRNRDDDPMDVHGHGTHCAGIAGAVTNNNKGISGVSWNCKIMPLRVGFAVDLIHYSNIITYGFLEDEDVIDAIDYAIQNQVDVISMSFGGSIESEAVKDACNRAWNAGIILCASSGNSNKAVSGYPARYENVISVGAVDQNRDKCEFSNYGSGLSIMAPGSNILTTLPNNKYGLMSGTSMACPHVAGVAALAFSRYTNKDNVWIRDKIESTSDYIGSKLKYGSGLVDASFTDDPKPPEPEGIVRITVDYIEAIDEVDPIDGKKGEWFYEVSIYDDYDGGYNEDSQKKTQYNYNKDYEPSNPIGWNSTKKWEVDTTHEFYAFENQYWVDVSFKLFDNDIDVNEEIDVSDCMNENQYAIRYYFFNDWEDPDPYYTTSANFCEDIIKDGDYLIAKGDTDGEQNSPNAKIRFKVETDYKMLREASFDAVGFHKYNLNFPEWVEPNTEISFEASVDKGATPITWEVRYGDGETYTETTEIGVREISLKYTYSLDNGNTRTITAPKVYIIDKFGAHTDGSYRTHSGHIHITNPPEKPIVGREGRYVWAQADDPEEDGIYYLFTWDDGTKTRYPEFANNYVESGTRAEIISKSKKVDIKVIDQNGAESDISSLSKTRSISLFEQMPVFLKLSKFFESSIIFKIFYR